MKLVKHAEDVYEIEDFLNQEERMAFLSKAEEDLDWETLRRGTTVKDMGDELSLRINKIFTTIKKLFINGSMNYPRDLRRLKDSEFMWPHTDGGNPNDPRKIMFGIVIYLNDNFCGGELIYPDLGLSITPKAGSLVIHSAHLKHQVFPVVEGERYSITCFVFGNESTKLNMLS
jgi:Rps23 Pro-64 3,4-dihydroxylase Tpa1-like proline 4-hydroxylase